MIIAWQLGSKLPSRWHHSQRSSWRSIVPTPRATRPILHTHQVPRTSGLIFNQSSHPFSWVGSLHCPFFFGVPSFFTFSLGVMFFICFQEFGIKWRSVSLDMHL